MANEKEHKSSTRTLLVLRAIIQSPKRYTKKELANKHSVSTYAIDDDFTAIKNAGFELEYDENYRYAIVLDKSFEYLKSLLVFSPKEESLIIEGLQNIKHDETTADRLMRKISRIYDVSKMHNTFDKSFLTKMDKLEKAKTEKKVVLLKDYPSTNSNNVTNRTIEAFHISPEDDIVHAFDLEKHAIRHFRISRITKLDISPTPWTHEGHHNIVATDPFRIQDNNQVKVLMRLQVGAHNEMVERFPLCRAYLKESPEGEGLYDFEGKVNHQFFGLLNFIMGYQTSIVSILEPETLIELIREEARKLAERKF